MTTRDPRIGRNEFVPSTASGKDDAIKSLEMALARVREMDDDQVLVAVVLLAHKDPAFLQADEEVGVETIGTIAPAWGPQLIHSLRYAIAQVALRNGYRGNRAERRRRA